MARVTNLTVKYGRTIQPEPYCSKSAEASISVSFDDDDIGDAELTESRLNSAMHMAKREVHATLGLAHAGYNVPKTVIPSTDEKMEKVAQEVAATEKPKRKRRTKAEIEADKAAAEAEKTGRAISDTPEDRVETIEDDDPLGLGLEADLVTITEAEVAITEADMGSAVTAKVSELRDLGIMDFSDKIKGCIHLFNTENAGGFRFKDIPLKARKSFLDALAALS